MGRVQGIWVFGWPGDPHHRTTMTHAAELTVPVNAPVERFDFEQQDIEGWKQVDGL